MRYIRRQFETPLPVAWNLICYPPTARAVGYYDSPRPRLPAIRSAMIAKARTGRVNRGGT